MKLNYAGELTCTYPAYNDGWKVSASPDGTLTDAAGQTYNYLYWEGVNSVAYDFSEGFCVAGSDTAVFLENALNQLGLTRKEANEFIVYWLPLMKENPYNLIAFQFDSYTQTAQLSIEPAPDTLLRVFMAWKPLESAVDISTLELKNVKLHSQEDCYEHKNKARRAWHRIHPDDGIHCSETVRRD